MDPRTNLEAALEGADVEGYHLTLSEEDGRTTTSLTNPAVRDLVTLEREDTELPLRYTRIEEPGEPPKIYRSMIRKEGDSLSLVTTDLSTNAILDTVDFPVAGGECTPQFPSLQACIADFECTHKGALLCEANRTCEPQFAGLTCCLENGQIFSVHLVYPPTSIRCQLRGLVPELEGLVSRSN